MSAEAVGGVEAGAEGAAGEPGTGDGTDIAFFGAGDVTFWLAPKVFQWLCHSPQLGEASNNEIASVIGAFTKLPIPYSSRPSSESW